MQPRYKSKLRVLGLVTATCLLVPLLISAQQDDDSKNLDLQLRGAASRGDTALVQSLLEQGANIEAKHSGKYSVDREETPLILAAEGAHAETLKLLLARGANPNATDKYGRTALMHAVKHARYGDIAQLLLDKGASVEAKDKDGLTALMLAASYRQSDAIEFLVSHRADVNAVDNRGRSALDWAAETCNQKAVTFLVQKGLKFQAGGNRDEQLRLAAAAGQLETMKQLIEQGAKINRIDPMYKSTPLLGACACGQTPTVLFLLNQGANAQAKTWNGLTPLMLAAGEGHSETVALLLAKIATAGAKELDEALNLAAVGGHADTVSLLLEKGANINATDEQGRTPLWNAAFGGDTATVTLLLKKGANNIDAVDSLGNTGLYWAVQTGHVQMVKLLLSNGANVNAKDKDGITPLHLGLGLHFLKVNPDIAALLLDGKPDRSVITDALVSAAGRGDSIAVKLFLEKGSDVNATTADSYEPNTALTRAAYDAQADMVKFLLEKGANANLKDAKGESAFFMAVQHDHSYRISLNTADAAAADYKTVGLLLDSGVDVNQLQPGGSERTPLLIAVLRSDIQMIKLLLSKGANVSSGDHAGDSPLSLALDANPDLNPDTRLNLGIATLLLEKASSDARKQMVDRTLPTLAFRGDTAGVQLLLDKGSNVDIKDKNGNTALINAADNDHIDTVKLLLDRGADPSATDNGGRTALANAIGFSGDTSHKPDTQLVELLRNARRTARQELQEKVALLATNSRDEALREDIIRSAAKLTPPPAIPDEARKALVEGATLMKSMHSLDDFLATQDKFEKAIEKAPYWADAYYDYASALEQMGWYDKAAKQLKIYLLFDLPQDEAQKVRDRINALGTQQEVATRNGEEEQRKERMKYVTGGAQRISSGEAPPEWKPQSGSNRLAIEGIYAYTLGSRYNYPNVFKMPNGHYIAATLVALSSSSRGYAGDQVFITDITHADNVHGRIVTFGTLNDQINLSGFAYKVSISERNRDGVITVVDQSSGAGFTLPIANLYVDRYLGALDSGSFPNFDLGYAPGSDTIYVLFFNNKLTSSGCFGKCAPGADQDPLSLTPTYVVALDRKDEPIGDTGYFIRWHGTTWKVEK